MSHWQASTSSPCADNDDNNDDDDGHRHHARRHVLRRTQQQRQRHVHRDADDDDDDDDEAYGNDTFAYAVDDAYGDVDDDDDARDDDDDDAAYDNRTQRRVRRREHYPHHHHHNHRRRSSAASPHYVDAYYSGGGDSHRRRSPVYSTASHATSAAAAAAAVAGEDDASDAGSGGGSSRSSTRPSRLRAFLTRLYSSSDEQRGLLTSSTARSAARASSTSRQQPQASQRQQPSQQAYMTSGDGGGGYDTYDIYDPYDKDDDDDGDDDDVDSRRRRRRVAAATRAATNDDDDAVHAEDDDDDAVAAAATDNSGGGHRRRDADDDDDDDDDEAAVWREMRDVEEATQLWPRATGALHTTTVLQPHHLRRHSSGDTQSHAHRHSGGDKDDSSDHNRDSDKDKKDDNENDDDDASTHAHSQLGSGAEETLAQRMHYGVLADPRAQIVDMIVHSATGSVTVQHIRERFAWDDEYARMYGSVTEYLQSYQAIFVVSPVDDRVRLRRVRIDPAAIAAAAAATAARASSSSSTWHQHHHRDRSQLLLQQQAQHERGRRRLYTPPPPPSPRAHRRSSSRQQQQQQRRSHSSNPRYRRSQRQQQQQQQQRRRRQSSSRRGVRDRDDAAAVAAMNIGSVSSSCVADHFDLDELAIAYRRRGYDVVMVYDVLHVSSARVFDLFLFANGLVVWWGKDRSHHWMVEDDFLSSTSYVHSAVRQRYAQADIETLFPNWCSYAEDDAYGEADTSVSPFGYRHDVVDAALARFGTVLCFDHYLVPAAEPARSQVMLTLSYSLGRTARADYFEHITQSSHRHVLSIPSELHGVLDHFATRRRIVRLEGELQMALLGITSLKDTPDFLWEMPWLDGYYALAEEQNSSEQRLLWFSARSDALLEQLSNLKARRHVLFLLGSDVFLIVLLIIDVLCMTARLMVALYFGILRD